MFSINDAKDISEQWFILYGTAAASYLRWIWNLRISSPDQKIYQHFDDVANASVTFGCILTLSAPMDLAQSLMSYG